MLALSGCFGEDSPSNPSKTRVERIADALENYLADRRPPTELSRQTVLENMSAVVWGDGGNQLHRWVDDLHITLHPTEDELIHDSIVNMVQQWDDVADLPAIHITRLTEKGASAPESSNFQVVFVDSSDDLAERLPDMIDVSTEEARAQNKEPACGVRTTFGEDGAIGPVLIIVAETADFWEKRECFLSFGLRSLGFPNFQSGQGYTFFDPHSNYEVMTRLDEIMLGILYDERLSPGTDLETGLPIAEEILSEMLPDE